MTKPFLTISLLLTIALTAMADTYRDVTFDASQRYSHLIISSRLSDFYSNTSKRGINVYDADGKKVKSSSGTIGLDYVAGLVAKAVIEAAEYYSSETQARAWYYSIEDYANTCVSSVPTTGGSLDNLNAAKMYPIIFDLTSSDGPFAAIAASSTLANAKKGMERATQGLKDSNANYVITSKYGSECQGGWFHKSSYPQQMWLDGQYMGPALLAQLLLHGYTISGDATTDWKTITRQFDITWRYLWDASERLPYHAFSADPTGSYAKTWADPVSWHSQEFWGRACGWYFLALVDIIEMMPGNIEYTPQVNYPVVDGAASVSYSSNCRERMKQYLTMLADGLAARQDATSGCWYQLLAHDGTYYATEYNGMKYAPTYNYLEASASAIFTAAYLKALRLGYLDEQTYGTMAEKAYRGVVQQFLKQKADDSYELINSCASAGLGGSKLRDGSAPYYLLGHDVTRITTYTEGKILGAFILAATEYERRQDSGRISSVISPMTATTASHRAFTVSGIPAAPNHHGIIISNGRKMAR